MQTCKLVTQVYKVIKVEHNHKNTNHRNERAESKTLGEVLNDLELGHNILNKKLQEKDG